MTLREQRRRGFRVSIRLEVIGTSGRLEVDGVLADISYSGALIEDTEMRPEIGTRVVLYVHVHPRSAFAAETPFELVGHVARHTSAGFAIEYNDNLDPDMRRMVDDAAALVAASR